MNPISKITTIFLGIVLLLPAVASAQRSDDWVQENWKRVSGEVGNFQDQFPDKQAGTGVVADRSSDGAFVRHADHEAVTQPVRPLADLSTQSISVDESILDENSGEMNLASWTDGIQGQLGQLDLQKVVSSLAIVLGGYFGFVWLMRKANPKMNAGLPSEVFELVGTTRLNTKQTLQLVRLGSKLLLLVHGEEGTHPIGEITDAEEVEYLTGICNSRTTTSRPASPRTPRSSRSASGFRNALDRANREGDTTEAAMDKVIRKLSELAGKPNRTDFEA